MQTIIKNNIVRQFMYKKIRFSEQPFYSHPMQRKRPHPSTNEIELTSFDIPDDPYVVELNLENDDYDDEIDTSNPAKKSFYEHRSY